MPQIVQVISFVISLASTAYSVSEGLKARRAAKRARREARERAARRNYRAEVPERVVIYGTRNIGGPFLYLDNPNRETLLAFVALASHECDAIEEVFLNEEAIQVPSGGGPVTSDEYVIEKIIAQSGFAALANKQMVVTQAEWESYPETGGFTAFGKPWTGKFIRNGSKYSGRMEIYPFLGGPGQNVSTKLTELGATNVVDSDRFEGVCGLLIKTYKLSEAFPELQANWNGRVRGRKVLLKDGSTGWSANPAECGRDWLENYHPAAVPPVIHEESWREAIDVNKQLVTQKDGEQVDRYQCNGIAIANEESREVLDQIQRSMGGSIRNAGGQWYFQAGVWTGEQVEYEGSEILSEIEVTLQGRSSDIPTHVKGRISSQEHNWSEVEYPAQRVGELTEPRVDLSYDLQMVTSHEQAQRIARIVGLQSRREFTASVKLGPRGILSRVGTVGRYTIPSMESAGSNLYELINFDREHGEDDQRGIFYECTHQIQETAESDFAWDPATMEQDLPVGSNNLSSNDSCEPSLIRFTRSDTATVPAVPDDPGTPGVDESAPEVPGETRLALTWIDPACKNKTLSFIRIKGVISGEERTEDVQPGILNGELVWVPEQAGIATVSGQAFYTDGTNSGEALGAMN